MLLLAAFIFNGAVLAALARPANQSAKLTIISPLPSEAPASAAKNKSASSVSARYAASPSAPEVASSAQVRVLLYRGSGPVKVSASPGGLLIDGRPAASVPMTLCSGNVSRKLKIQAQNGLLKLQDTAYRGVLEVYPDSGKIQIVNALGLEDYLRGVVPKELLCQELEAVKAQAILARTYALSMIAKSDAHSNWDLRDDTGHQVYGGASAEHAISDEAVRQTAGRVLTYGGKMCAAILYHSSCGGCTEDNSGAYGTAQLPYLSGVSCGLAPWQAKAADKRSQHARLASLEPARLKRPPSTLAERRARNDAGKLRAAPGAESASPASSDLGLHFALGSNTDCMANRFKYASGGTEAWCCGSGFARWEACWTPEELGQEVGRKLGKSPSPIVGLEVAERSASGRVKRLKVRFACGETGEVCGDTVRNTMCYRNSEGAWCTLPSSRFEVAEITSKIVRVRGTGWGHGVGMCQWGAKELARRGYEASRILAHYYKGAEVAPYVPQNR
ncbi:SpoIID/LytB domain-containing protein [bacterium]|nr:SpoIID/LytB domain-containing protein [bacterium]